MLKVCENRSTLIFLASELFLRWPFQGMPVQGKLQSVVILVIASMKSVTVINFLWHLLTLGELTIGKLADIVMAA